MDPELPHRRFSKRTLGRFQTEESGSGSPPVLMVRKPVPDLPSATASWIFCETGVELEVQEPELLLLLAVVAQNR